MAVSIYKQLAGQMEQAGLVCDPAALQGVLCGVLSMTPDLDESRLLALLARYGDIASLPASLSQVWLACRDQIRQAYRGEDMDVQLLLPDRDAPLSQQVEALTGWCDGFLTGFAETGSGMTLPAPVQEALADLAAISQAEIPQADGESQRQLFVQIEEHCRMIALTVFTEMALQQRRQSRTSHKPVAH